MRIIDLSNSLLQMRLVAEEWLILAQGGSRDFSWLAGDQPAELFALDVDGRRITGADLSFNDAVVEETEPGARCHCLVFTGAGLRVDYYLKTYADTALVEAWPVVTNLGAIAQTIERIDSFVCRLPALDARLMSFTGDWGSEFEPHETMLREPVRLESRSGRSTKGNHPWFSLTEPGGQVFSAAVVWSGNWVMRFDPLPAGGWRFSGGLNDWSFSKTLQPGAALQGPPVVLVFGVDQNHVSQQYAAVGRRHWYPRNSLSTRLPVEWNHWWPYEDVEINEAVFRENLARAARMGMEVCTLDAGWFGPSDPNANWYEYRGDWQMVNTRRFPGGIRPLADLTHQFGMRFGIWCEIEGLGIHARLAEEHPAYVALREGQRVGCVCFGNPEVQEWAYQTLARLITEYACDWIKLDFNLDPGAGCNRTDHGHAAGDGLYAHYQGYYRTLERIRQDFPEVVLENCSSGGLRIDLAILRQTHMTFLSDPDWPVHDLQIFWGASTMLAPDVLLHWSFCEWRNTNPPRQQNFNPRDPALTRHQLDYYTRISMLGLFGFSQKLPDLPAWVAERLTTLTQIYQKQVRRFVAQADLYRLTRQPLRSGAGERWCAFQYSLHETGEHLLFVFRLPGGEPERTILLQGLQPDARYTITGLEDEFAAESTGSVLLSTGLRFSELPEEGSALYLLRAA